MKKLVVKNIDACMDCLTCENMCAGSFYKKANPFVENLTCLHVTMNKNKRAIVTCVQCGTCAKACEYNAIQANKAGVYVIDKGKCQKCGKCVEACPFKVMVQAKDTPVPSKCISCGICARACPQNVLDIQSDAAA